MRINDFDENLKFKKKRTSNFSFIIKIVLIIFAMFMLFFIFFINFSPNEKDVNSFEIETNGEKYGESEFIKYNGKVYVLVWGNGMYTLNNVDIDTFRAISSEDFYSKVVGLDKNHVYFGNIAIPDLDPNKFYIIGNGYYSDGTNTYYCSPVSERNKDLSIISELFQITINVFSKNKKPQTYIYPYKKVETDKKLRAVKNMFSFATDGKKVYYNGEILENADLNTLKSVDGYTEYFVDKENVYYQSKLLPIKNSGELKIVSTKQGNRVLYDEANGYVFIEDYSFDREKTPYKVLGNGGNHLYDLFFIAKDGIYFYNTQKKKQERIGDNIFSGNIEELTPNVFTDDKNIYYFDTYDVWFKGKNTGHILTSKNTIIYYLDKKDNWEKVSDISDETIVGTIWKKGNDYYYFDEFYMKNTIYQIADKETLDYLLNANNINHDNMVNLVENKKLIVVNGEEKIRATTELNGVYRFVIKYSKIFIFILIAIGGIFRLYKNSKEKNKKITKIIKK